MDRQMFQTAQGEAVPAVTEEQMREVDRIAMRVFGLGVLQMMENAGRNLASHVIDMITGPESEITILAGPGGNGGGGLCAARHLHNRGYKIHLLLDRDPEALQGPARDQFAILESAGLVAAKPGLAGKLVDGAELVVDALIGYSLKGAPRGRVEELITTCNEAAARVLSLDLPSGMHATTGDTPGAVVHPERTLTLALPKTGLSRLAGELYLADIGIPPQVYLPLGIEVKPFFGGKYWIRLEIHDPQG